MEKNGSSLHQSVGMGKTGVEEGLINEEDVKKGTSDGQCPVSIPVHTAWQAQLQYVSLSYAP